MNSQPVTAFKKIRLRAGPGIMVFRTSRVRICKKKVRPGSARRECRPSPNRVSWRIIGLSSGFKPVSGPDPCRLLITLSHDFLTSNFQWRLLVCLNEIKHLLFTGTVIICCLKALWPFVCTRCIWNSYLLH